jgi:hypothetical protein
VPAGRRYRRRVTADPATSTSSRPAVAWSGLAGLAGGVTLMLLAVANRYGYHRDELYFLRAGREPAYGYVDQPPLTPLLAHAMDRIFDGSLVGLRLPSALAAGLVVLLTALIAREFGGGRGEQLLAAVRRRRARCAAPTPRSGRRRIRRRCVGRGPEAPEVATSTRARDPLPSAAVSQPVGGRAPHLLPVCGTRRIRWQSRNEDAGPGVESSRVVYGRPGDGRGVDE